jgi:hypothetical protein
MGSGECHMCLVESCVSVLSSAGHSAVCVTLGEILDEDPGHAWRGSMGSGECQTGMAQAGVSVLSFVRALCSMYDTVPEPE